MPRPSVLVIDDDTALLALLRTILQRGGYRVLSADNAIEGLRLAQEQHPDVIVCDVMMASVNGFELRRILAQEPATDCIPFLFLTARTAPADHLFGLELGADDYITKPFANQTLLARIKAVIRRDQRGRQRGFSEAQVSLERLHQRIGEELKRDYGIPPGGVIDTLDLALAMRFTGDIESQCRFIRAALANVRRLRDLLEDLLALNRLDQGQAPPSRQAVQLQEDFHAPLRECRQRWEHRRLQFDIAVEPDVLIYAPRSEFRRTVIHLIDNACRFSPPGGKVTVHLLPNGVGGCHLTVSDRGAGIPEALRTRVFERYFQAYPEGATEHAGLGLGLTLARAFARSLGGDVVIQDSLAGTRIHLSLPPGGLEGKALSQRPHIAAT